MLVHRIGVRLFDGVECLTYSGALKRDLLLFDELVFDPQQFERGRQFAELLSALHNKPKDGLAVMAADVEYLVHKGALSEISFRDVALDAQSKDEAEGLEAKAAELADEIAKGNDLKRVVVDGEKVVVSNSLSLSGYRNKRDLLSARNARLERQSELTICTPTMENPEMFFDFRGRGQESKLSEGDVLRLVMRAIPAPDDTVPIEHVLDFASDPEIAASRKRLRSWILDMSRKDLGLKELATHLEAEIATYEAHMRHARMKYSYSSLGNIIAVPLQVVSDIAKLDLGKAAKSVFAVGHDRVALLEAELKAPVREIAFISQARDEFLPGQ